MIALISFTEDIVMPLREAEELGLSYKQYARYGKRSGYSVAPMEQSYQYYLDEVEKREDENYYLIGTDKKIDSYYLYHRVTFDEPHVCVPKENHLVDLNDFALKCKYKFFIEKAVKDTAGPTDINYLLSRIEEKTREIDKTIDIMRSNQFNAKCDVHVGGGLIVTYNDLKLKENCCTDELQCELNNGWRIIAVCVQPDQRRPDYVMGRYNPELDTYRKNSAER